MKNKFSEFEGKKQELNCGVNVIPIISYFQDLYGFEKTKEIVEPLGLPIDFLLNKRNWVSNSYYLALLDKLVEITGDEKAPYKAPFSMRPQSIMKDLIFSTYGTLFLGSPKIIYKVLFNPSVYKRFGKAGDFKILSFGANSVTVELSYKDGFKQHKNNCLAIQGFLALGPTSFGLPPATIEHDHCAADGYETCIYTIKWQNKKKFNLFNIVILILAVLTVAFEVFFLNSFFTIKDIIITLLSFISFTSIVKTFQYLQKIRTIEIFNFERNNSVLESMEKIEKNYNEILDTKKKLEEHNKLLSIINQINQSITEAYHFDLLVSIVAKTILIELDFTKAAYFQLNLYDKQYHSEFEMIHEKNNPNEPVISYHDLKLSKNEYELINTGKIIFHKDDIKNLNKFESRDVINWLDNKTISDNIFYFLPLEIKNIYSGFFLFFSNKKVATIDYQIETLFKNIASQLKVGFQKISSRYVIENILSSMPSNVIIFNADTLSIRYVNKMFLSTYKNVTTKYDNKKLIGSNLTALNFLSDDDIKHIKNIASNIELTKSDRFEVNVNSNVFEYSIFSIPQYKDGEKLVGLILTDITEARYFQQKILINEKLLALGRVASGIAHEINNPLYAILANAEEIAEDEALSPEIRDYAEEMIEHVMNVSNIIKDLSQYSKTLRKEKSDEIDINSIIEESLKLVRYSSNFLEINIQTNLTKIPAIKAAKGEMQQIFINLFNNAIQAMNGRGVLDISSEYNNNNIFIKIRDTGTGIKKEVLPNIFKLYFTTKEPGKGTGQGLHIVKKIVDMYNGNITVESEVGVGTTFFINFKVEEKN